MAATRRPRVSLIARRFSEAQGADLAPRRRWGETGIGSAVRRLCGPWPIGSGANTRQVTLTRTVLSPGAYVWVQSRPLPDPGEGKGRRAGAGFTIVAGKGPTYESAAVRAREATASAAHVSPPTAKAAVGRAPSLEPPSPMRHARFKRKPDQAEVARSSLPRRSRSRGARSEVVAANNGSLSPKMRGAAGGARLCAPEDQLRSCERPRLAVYLTGFLTGSG
jgi:hypothetical protein